MPRIVAVGFWGLHALSLQLLVTALKIKGAVSEQVLMCAYVLSLLTQSLGSECLWPEHQCGLMKT